jgi:hypothetical protein
MAGKKPSESDLQNLLHPEAIHHDLYFVGTQESLKSIGASMLSPSKEVMNKMIGNCLGDNYRMVSSVSLQATHLVIFAHIRMIPLISEVKDDFLATGFKKMMGNKGAVTIQFKLAQTKIRVINSHFHSGQDKCEVRNQDFNTIFTKFCVPKVSKTKNQVLPSVDGKGDEISDDALFFMGDFNYRINGVKSAILMAMQ